MKQTGPLPGRPVPASAENSTAIPPHVVDPVRRAHMPPRATTGPGNAKVPRHLAVILDGNRRWARERDLPALAGYEQGARRVLDFLRWCEGVHGMETITLWPLSAENLKRPPHELAALLQVIAETTEEIAASQRWRIRLIGDVARLTAQLADRLFATTRSTSALNRPTVNIAVAYSGRDEITRAVRNLLLAHQAAGTLHELERCIQPDDIDCHLDTAGQPDPDLVIRSSGEHRLSGFMPWQTEYSEFYFCPSYWPDFSRSDLDQALRFYAGRRRRFGL